MIEKTCGSLSINIAPFSSLSTDILPLNNAVKNVSGIHVSVCRDVVNLVRKLIKYNTTTFLFL